MEIKVYDSRSGAYFTLPVGKGVWIGGVTVGKDLQVEVRSATAWWGRLIFDDRFTNSPKRGVA